MFLCVRSEVAILYNDRSVLENHHVSAAYKLMAEEDMNILVNLNKDDWRFAAQVSIFYLNSSKMCQTDSSLTHSRCSSLCLLPVFQRTEVSGDWDGDVHRHVLPLPADQDHEERPDTDTWVSDGAPTFDLSMLDHLVFCCGDEYSQKLWSKRCPGLISASGPVLLIY